MQAGWLTAAAVHTKSRAQSPVGFGYQWRISAAVTGKPAGDDLREGKRTALIAVAMDRATDRQLKDLKSNFGDPNLTSEQVNLLQEIITSTGAASHIESMIKELTDASLAALKHGGITPVGINLLTELAILATNRKI